MHGLNKKRMSEIQTHGGKPRFNLGERVVRKDYADEKSVHDGDTIGVIDVVYVDFQSVLDSQAVQRDWYEAQDTPLRTPKDHHFYSVVLDGGAIIAGEDDLEHVT